MSVKVIMEMEITTGIPKLGMFMLRIASSKDI
jgi:hypothetical protein